MVSTKNIDTFDKTISKVSMLMPVRANKISARTFVKTGKGHYTDRHRDSRTGKGGREET